MCVVYDIRNAMQIDIDTELPQKYACHRKTKNQKKRKKSKRDKIRFMQRAKKKKNGRCITVDKMKKKK